MKTLKLSQNSKKEIESFLLNGGNKNNEIGQGYKREKTYLYTDNSELASWPPKSTAISFIYNQYLQPGTLLFFTSGSVIYTNHLKCMLNLYLQILRLHFVAMRAKIDVITDNNQNNNNNNNKNEKKKIIYLYDIFPDFIEFDCNLFTFELFESYNKDNNMSKINYDGIKTIKFETIMIIAKKWIAG
eukprot:313770_1